MLRDSNQEQRSMNLAIRPETPRDEAAIETVVIEAFREAVHSSHTEQFIVRALRKAANPFISLVAELEGEIIGHVAASTVHIADGSVGWFGLGPLSVLPGFQRRGVGSLLMHEVCAILRARHAAGCVLLGDPAYYRRFGFAPQPGLVLSDVPPEYFQALSFDGSLPEGIATYHDAFAAQR